jgi:nucleotide-binding universal stress UspA family protein
VLEGEVPHVILQYIIDCKADLIVVGADRHRGLERLLLPYVAMQILRHAKIPMLTVPIGEG